jgi:hypothetical protein
MTLAKKEISPEERRAAAAAMGSITTPKKAEASARNGFKPGNKLARNGGRHHKAITELDCNCTGGDSLEENAHKWRCPRGQAIRRRISEGRDVLTGVLLSQTTSLAESG